MTIIFEKEQKLLDSDYCSGCELYSELQGPKCIFEKLIKDNLDLFVTKTNNKLSCKRPENCKEEYGN